MDKLEKMRTLFGKCKAYPHYGDLKVLCTPDFFLEIREEMDKELEDQISKSAIPFSEVGLPLPYGLPVITTNFLPDNCNPCAIDHKRGAILSLAADGNEGT
jgi:hypothetical protein